MAANVFGTMTLGGSQISIINNDVNIIGYPGIGSDTLVVSGGNTNRIFRIVDSSVNIKGLTLANARAVSNVGVDGHGSAVFASGGANLTLDQVTVRNNAAFKSAVEVQVGTHQSLIRPSTTTRRKHVPPLREQRLRLFL